MTVLLVAGTIGAGKSTLTDMIADKMQSKPFYENVDDNEVLPLFYSDPNRYAFLLQIFFLNKRFLAMKEALQQDNNVLDRSIYEDSLLFHLNADFGRISQIEVNQYDSLLHTMLQELEANAPKKRPDLMIFIKVSFETMLKRIEKRGRDYEQIAYNPDLYEYYQELNRRYNQWYENFDLCPKLIIDGDQYDFVSNPQDAKRVLELIQQAKNKLEAAPLDIANYQTENDLEKGIFAV
ncbi:MAG: deoxynucleoside kinase [Enterococcus sp.]